jgi:hypothetical protein
MNLPDHSRTASKALRSRLIYAAATLCVVAAGLLWRRPELGLPPFAAKYGGSVLWGAMVFFAVATLSPTTKLRIVALIAAVIAAGVELSQLVHIDWLDAFRSTTVGALLLGRTFTWWDIAAYWVGIATALAFTRISHR